jgi:hypothetical protein
VKGFLRQGIIYLGWLQTVILLISASSVARIIGMSCWHPPPLAILTTTVLVQEEVYVG